jgi:alpha-D-ribose 1-methylphosphonate 5-triphosphate synthase subunit PhnG
MCSAAIGKKAQMIALCDALVQSDQFAGAVENVVAPLRRVIVSIEAAGAGDSGDTSRFLYAGARRGVSDDDGCRTACRIRG